MKTCRIVIALAWAGLAMNAMADDDLRNIPFNKLPEVVQSAARGVIGGAEIERSGEEAEGGDVYVVQFKSGGRHFEVEISPAGKVTEIGELIPLNGAPGAIQKAINEKAKGALYVKIEKATQDQKGVYIVELINNAGKEGKLVLDPQGRIISEKFEK